MKIVILNLLFFLLLSSLSFGENSGILNLKNQTDSLFILKQNSDTNIISKTELFNTIKETFETSKKCYNSVKVGDSLFVNNFYYDATLEYLRAEFYCKNKTFLDTIKYKTANSLFFDEKYKKSNLKIESVLDTFNFVELANTKPKFSTLYIKNLLKQKEYYKVYDLTTNLFNDKKYLGLNYKEFTHYNEFSAVVLGKVPNIDDIKNSEAKEILSDYINTPTKNTKTTYYLATFLPGSGYIYNGNYKMGVISAMVNIPLAIYLGSRLWNISDGIIEENREKIITNSLDFVLIYNFVFGRYWKGARRESIKESEKINSENREKAIKEIREAYGFSEKLIVNSEQ